MDTILFVSCALLGSWRLDILPLHDFCQFRGVKWFLMKCDQAGYRDFLRSIYYVQVFQKRQPRSNKLLQKRRTENTFPFLLIKSRAGLHLNWLVTWCTIRNLEARSGPVVLNIAFPSSTALTVLNKFHSYHYNLFHVYLVILFFILEKSSNYNYYILNQSSANFSYFIYLFYFLRKSMVTFYFLIGLAVFIPIISIHLKEEIFLFYFG